MDEYIERISIPLDEYKELLTIKGKYEELKSIYYGVYSSTKIAYRDDDSLGIAASPYKVSYDKSVEDLGV